MTSGVLHGNAKNFTDSVLILLMVYDKVVYG
jgi:hypothetical protein